MSTFAVEVVKIDDVQRHPNADRLDIVQVKGWNCVTGRERFKPGDLAIYIPIDSVLDEKIETYLFPPDSKVKLSKSRVKTVKLRGAISQGLVVDITDELVCRFPDLNKAKLGTNVADILGIHKYEPPAEDIPPALYTSCKRPIKRAENPNFSKYTDIENLKNYNAVFEDMEPVSVTEKLHGTSARYAKLETVPTTWWQKVLRFFGLLPKTEFCYGSRNVQLQSRWPKKTFYGHDVYGRIAQQEELANKLLPGEAVYGEIVGPGIQKGYTYGVPDGQVRFFAYDVKVNGEYLDPDRFRLFCGMRGIETVPLVYEGPFIKGLVDALKQGDSTIGGQKVREGIVIKPQRESRAMCGRKVLKHINDDYLLSDQTEFH